MRVIQHVMIINNSDNDNARITSSYLVLFQELL